jgi:hypothetical protein
LADVVATYDGVPELIPVVLNDGATILREDRRVAVSVRGTAVIGMKQTARSSHAWGTDEFTDKLFAFILDEVLPRIEPFARA